MGIKNTPVQVREACGTIYVLSICIGLAPVQYLCEAVPVGAGAVFVLLIVDYFALFFKLVAFTVLFLKYSFLFDCAKF